MRTRTTALPTAPRRKRSYDSSLRGEQAGQTRERILAAFAEQLAEARDDFSIPKVAARAGVSLRTVYHHFPNRDSQVRALAEWLERRIGVVDEPRSAGELPAYAARMYERFADHESLIRAQLTPGIAEHVRARRRSGRVAAIERCVRDTNVGPDDVKLASALLKHVISADAGVALMDRYGLTIAEATGVARWLVGLIVGALRHKSGPAAAVEPAR
jgi:AcrR family transcriptional regulator